MYLFSVWCRVGLGVICLRRLVTPDMRQRARRNLLQRKDDLRRGAQRTSGFKSLESGMDCWLFRFDFVLLRFYEQFCSVLSDYHLLGALIQASID